MSGESRFYQLYENPRSASLSVGAKTRVVVVIGVLVDEDDETWYHVVESDGKTPRFERGNDVALATSRA